MADQKENHTLYLKRTDVDRNYRSNVDPDLLKYRLVIGESDLMVLTSAEIKTEVEHLLKLFRRQLKEYIFIHPVFAKTLTPFPKDDTAPELIKWMIEASAKVKVGPMAAVAGAIAGMIGKTISMDVSELIIENGGDIYLRSSKERTVAIYAGASVLSNQIGILLPPKPSGIGICTSAGTVGPSLSFGKADAVVIISPDVALADAAATAIGNIIPTETDLQPAINHARKIKGLSGVLLIKNDKMAVWGDLTIVPLVN